MFVSTLLCGSKMLKRAFITSTTSGELGFRNRKSTRDDLLLTDFGVRFPFNIASPENEATTMQSSRSAHTAWVADIFWKEPLMGFTFTPRWELHSSLELVITLEQNTLMLLSAHSMLIPFSTVNKSCWVLKACADCSFLIDSREKKWALTKAYKFTLKAEKVFWTLKGAHIDSYTNKELMVEKRRK